MAMDGPRSEDRACDYLRAQGYRLLARNWRVSRGEIDIIAREGETLVFVEVKARSGKGFGGPEAAVHPAKQRRLIEAARAFIAETACELPMRFDVVAVEGDSIRLHRDAFQVEA